MAAAFDHAPILQTTRLFLREVRASDVTDHYYRWLNDPEVTQYLEVRYTPQSRENIARFVANMDGKRDEMLFAICLVEDGRHIGNTGLHRATPENRTADLGIMIGEKDCWGQGYGTDAVRTLLRFGFEEMNLNRVALTVYDFNERAIASYRKCGFIEEGRLRQGVYQRGRYIDVLLMSVLRSEWEAAHSAAEGPAAR